MHPLQQPVSPIDLKAVIDEWLNECGPCDYGLPMGCACPDGDYRPVIMALVDELAIARAALDEAVNTASRRQ